MKSLFALPLLTTLVALPSFAADVQTLAPVRAVTLYPNGATLTRVISAVIPAGSHRILFPMSQDALNAGPPRIRATSGFQFGAQEYLPGYITDPSQVYTPAQADAFGQLENLKDQRLALADRIANGMAAVEAAQAQLAFIRSISGGTLDEIDVTSLADVAAMIGQQTTEAATQLQSAKEALRADQDALREIDTQIAQAQRDFERTTPFAGPVGMMAVSVDVETDQTVEFTLDHLIRAAGWGVDYEMFLDRDAGTLDVSRKVAVQQYSSEVWTDVELVLSTADPAAQIDPNMPEPSQAFLTSQTNKRSISAPSIQADLSEGASMRFANPVEAEVASTFAPVSIDGLSVSYTYPERVTIQPDGGTLVLSLDQFQLDADIFNRASPRFDATAFLMAKFTNSTPEPMLPGSTSLYRDGMFVGRGRVGMVPAGAEETLAFGPLEGIRLSYTRLNNDTGDAGIITRADMREQALEITVENLTGQAELVETLFALPFSEQEDLTVTTRARPKPDATDFEQKRNVGQWMLQLAPGEKQTVRIDVEMSWPQGQVLRWQP